MNSLHRSKLIIERRQLHIGAHVHIARLSCRSIFTSHSWHLVHRRRQLHRRRLHILAVRQPHQVADCPHPTSLRASSQKKEACPSTGSHARRAGAKSRFRSATCSSSSSWRGSVGNIEQHGVRLKSLLPRRAHPLRSHHRFGVGCSSFRYARRAPVHLCNLALFLLHPQSELSMVAM